MEYKDYYKTLGVAKTATPKEIKEAFRRLARKHHPDMNAGDPKAEARFKTVNEAHEVLSDPDKRRRYDQLGANWSAYSGRPGGPSAGGPFRGGRVHVDFADLGGGTGFSDFFKTFFSGGGGSSAGGFDDLFGGAGGGGDVEHAIDLTLEDVARGTTRLIELDSGRVKRRVEVKVPAGVKDGARVRASGEGEKGRGGRQGDLYLRVRVLPHPSFERSGDDLVAPARVPLSTAVLGGEAMVQTMDGKAEVRVPPGSPTGRVLRLRGQGLPRLQGEHGRGDLLVKIEVELPRDLSKRERELFEELRSHGR